MLPVFQWHLDHRAKYVCSLRLNSRHGTDSYDAASSVLIRFRRRSGIWTPTAFRDDLFPSVLMDSECEWRLCIQTSTAIEEWGIEVDLSSPYALSSGLSTITLELDGQRDVTQADMLLSSFCFLSVHCRDTLCHPPHHCNSFGFGDGTRWISMTVDFDGMHSTESLWTSRDC